MEKGADFPAIKVDGDVIVDGHHRYIASKIVGKEIGTVPGTLPLNKQGAPGQHIKDIDLSEVDY